MTRFNFKIAALIFLAAAFALLFFLGDVEKSVSNYVFDKLKKTQTLGFFPLRYGFVIGGSSGAKLAAQNKELAGRVEDLEAKLAAINFQSRREELLAGVASNAAGAVWAGIILAPPGLAYDQLIIDKGIEDGVAAGNMVLAGKNIILGYVEETFDSTSRVILLSSFGREQNLFLEKAGSAMLAVGKGANQLEASLPRDFPVETGENLFTLTEPPYLAGLVEKIDSGPSSPVKKLKIRQPFNLNNLRSVNILTWSKK
ncbi:MAG: rod shape-determining protein MreC [Patescibacteria group bacterium]